MMQAEPRLDVGRLLDLLTSQRERYRKLRKLADRQRMLVSGDDPQSLLSVLGERQRIVDELGRLNDELSPYRSAWTRTYQSLDEATRDRVRGVLEESNGLLASVVAADRDDLAALGARRETTAMELNRTHHAGRAAAAYATAGRATGSRLTEARA
jgi:hypothetical protein